MAEPSLAWTPPTLDYNDTANGAITVFSFRGGYLAEAQDAVFNDWATWASSSGDSDQKEIANNFSGYAYTVFFDANGWPALSEAGGTVNGVAVANYPQKNGLCSRDIIYDYGGLCYFYQCDGCDISTRANPDSGTHSIETFRLNDDDFATHFETGNAAYTAGYEYYDAIVAQGDLSTSGGIDYF